MISHLLTTKDTKESKKHCRKSHFTKERPVLSKITKNIIAALHFWQKIGENSQRISFRCFRQNVYVLWFLHITRTFSCFLFISLLISSTSFTTTKYTFVKWKSRGLQVISNLVMQGRNRFCPKKWQKNGGWKSGK